MVFNIFSFCLTLSLTKKLKTTILEMLISPKPLNINNLRTTSPKPINFHAVTKLIRCSLKKVDLKDMLALTIFTILLFECMSVLLSSQWSTGSERINVSVENLKNIANFVEITFKLIKFTYLRSSEWLFNFYDFV